MYIELYFNGSFKGSYFLVFKFCLNFVLLYLIYFRPGNGGKYCEGESRMYRLCAKKVVILSLFFYKFKRLGVLLC